MKLLEFITYCELKGLVREKHKTEQLWDSEVGYHYRINIISEDKRKRLVIVYAVLNDTGVMVNNSLYRLRSDLHLVSYAGNLNLSDIVKEFMPQ